MRCKEHLNLLAFSMWAPWPTMTKWHALATCRQTAICRGPALWGTLPSIQSLYHIPNYQLPVSTSMYQYHKSIEKTKCHMSPSIYLGTIAISRISWNNNLISKPPSSALWFDVGPWNAFWWPVEYDPRSLENQGLRSEFNADEWWMVILSPTAIGSSVNSLGTEISANNRSLSCSCYWTQKAAELVCYTTYMSGPSKSELIIYKAMWIYIHIDSLLLSL